MKPKTNVPKETTVEAPESEHGSVSNALLDLLSWCHENGRRIIIKVDHDGLYFRRLLVDEHDIDRNHKVYRCDKHLGVAVSAGDVEAIVEGIVTGQVQV